MGETHILRVPRVDDDGGYVLIQVTPNGRKDLDLKLLATDGLSPFVAELKQSRVSTLKEKKHPCSEDEWERILTEVLLDRQSDPEIEAAAHVEPDESVTLIVRRSISGIKQRIGSITLKYREDEGIELFDWCGNAVEAKEQVKADLSAATTKVEELQNAVDELKDQLEELIEAKKADETELLEKFRDLLNEKKVKIREQQRMLMANDVDVSGFIKPEPKSQSQPKIPETTKGRKPKPSRRPSVKLLNRNPSPNQKRRFQNRMTTLRRWKWTRDTEKKIQRMIEQLMKRRQLVKGRMILIMTNLLVGQINPQRQILGKRRKTSQKLLRHRELFPSLEPDKPQSQQLSQTPRLRLREAKPSPMMSFEPIVAYYGDTVQVTPIVTRHATFCGPVHITVHPVQRIVSCTTCTAGLIQVSSVVFRGYAQVRERTLIIRAYAALGVSVWPKTLS